MHSLGAAKTGDPVHQGPDTAVGRNRAKEPAHDAPRRGARPAAER
jgi:hypothetical protein